jgi:UDP-GlcNAc:undecaprenyl-phosphate GlcNAc-1-phosphate transferase
MGDGGSIFLGFALAWYLIQLSQGANAAYPPVTALWLFAVPLIDTITIMVRRVRHGHSPFAADREHLHHILLLAGFGANRTVLIILASHLCCILFGVAGLYFGIPEWVMFFLFAALFAGYFYSMTHAWKLMKKVKHFREWAGFEDRRHEGDAEGARKDRRTVEVDIDGADRRKGVRSGQA